MDAIDRYLQQSGKTLSRLADDIGCAPSTMTRIAKGEREPSFELAERVERATGGKLSAAQFLQACLEKKRTAAA